MMALVEKVEMEVEDVTHQEISQEERGLESGSNKPVEQKKYEPDFAIILVFQFLFALCPRCVMDYMAIREANIAENRADRVRLGLVEEKKPKQAAVKRKKMPAPAPTRRSSRVKELPKVNYDDEDWEVQPCGKRRKVDAKSDQVKKMD